MTHFKQYTTVPQYRNTSGWTAAVHIVLINVHVSINLCGYFHNVNVLETNTYSSLEVHIVQINQLMLDYVGYPTPPSPPQQEQAGQEAAIYAMVFHPLITHVLISFFKVWSCFLWIIHGHHNWIR